MAPRHLAVEQQRQPLGMAERTGVAVLVELDEGLGHALQAERLKLVEGRMGKHGQFPQ